MTEKLGEQLLLVLLQLLHEPRVRVYYRSFGLNLMVNIYHLFLLSFHNVGNCNSDASTNSTHTMNKNVPLLDIFINKLIAFFKVIFDHTVFFIVKLDSFVVLDLVVLAELCYLLGLDSENSSDLILLHKNRANLVDS